MLAITLRLSSSPVRSTASRSLYTGIFRYASKQYNAATTTIPTPKQKHISSNHITTRQYHSTPISSAVVSSAFNGPSQARKALIAEIANFPDEVLEPFGEHAFNSIRKVLFDPRLNHVPSYIGGLCHEGTYFGDTHTVNAQMEDAKEGMMRVLRAWHMPAMISVRSLKPPFRKEIGVVSLEDYWRGTIAVLVKMGAMDMEVEAEVRRRYDSIRKQHMVELVDRMERLSQRYEMESKKIQEKYTLLEGQQERKTFPLAQVKKDWVKFYEDFARESEKQLGDPKLLDDPINSFTAYLITALGNPAGVFFEQGGAATKKEAAESSLMRSLHRSEVNAVCDEGIEMMQMQQEMQKQAMMDAIREHRGF
ncbi:hypothetical protein BJ508DRAFT_139601 [Ascobolus immersus RN42]|uniref:Uncharacterized protein n=1 Tax=Ascobolus immersus RN42 TaxID=1160509 RepID=A0A3N4I0S2_ASCIM|nr:hypothetical protein BJ508DRAFT_139601 [Ascobolus immersus RN42]